MDSISQEIKNGAMLQQAMMRKSVSNQYTTQCIQPLKATYTPNDVLRIIIQRSKHAMNLGDIKVFFRPIVQFQGDSLVSQAQKAMMCHTVHSPEDMFELTSLTANGNQLLSMASMPLQFGRGMFHQYYRSLTDHNEFKIGGQGERTDGISFPTKNMANQNLEEVAITHPSSQIDYTQSALPTSGYNLLYSRFEADSIPRAIISNCYSYNFQANIPPSNNKASYGNAYFTSGIDQRGEPCPDVNSGFVGVNGSYAGVAIAGYSQADTAYTQTSKPSFVYLPLCITPSISLYLRVQQRLQALRMRFISPITSFYSNPTTSQYAQANSVYQVDNIMGQMNPPYNLGTGFYSNRVLNGDQNEYPIGVNTWTPQKQVYGIPVQGSNLNGTIGGGQCVLGSQNTQRQTDFLTTLPNAQDSTWYPSECQTNLSIRLRDISVELDDLCRVPSFLDSTQWVIQLQLTPVGNCISAFLQPSFFSFGGNTQQSAGNALQGQLSQHPGNQAIAKFIGACMMNNVSYQITDVFCQLPYQTYDDQSYGIVREISYMPQQYRSILSFTDVLTTTNGQYNQRLSIGGSSLILGIISFIRPNFTPPTQNLSPIDTMVDYQNSSYVPSFNDSRCWWNSDACYVPYSSCSLTLDSKTYNVQPLNPISNPEFSTYLRSIDMTAQIFNGKCFNVDLQEFLIQRSFIALQINAYADRTQMAVDQQAVLQINFNDTVRQAYTKAFGFANGPQTSNCWYLQTYIITSQTLVSQDYVKL